MRPRTEVRPPASEPAKTKKIMPREAGWSREFSSHPSARPFDGIFAEWRLCSAAERLPPFAPSHTPKSFVANEGGLWRTRWKGVRRRRRANLCWPGEKKRGDGLCADSAWQNCFPARVFFRRGGDLIDPSSKLPRMGRAMKKGTEGGGARIIRELESKRWRFIERIMSYVLSVSYATSWRLWIYIRQVLGNSGAEIYSGGTSGIFIPIFRRSFSFFFFSVILIIIGWVKYM